MVDFGPVGPPPQRVRELTLDEAQHYGLGVRQNARIWRYVLPNNQTSDGGMFFLDSSGMFASWSAYGGFTYRWGSFSGDFRRFFADRDEHYLYGKLRHTPRAMRRTRDADATARAIRKLAWEQFGERGNVEDFQRELLLLENWNELDDEYSWVRFCGETHLETEAVWDCAVSNLEDPECMAFCRLLAPRLQALIRFQLRKEGNNP